jgi:Aminoglycoside-2''-adenylyltransferase
MSVADLAKRQLDVIAKLAALEPPPSFMGGFAEDAVLARTVTRPHEDVDLIFPRDEQELWLARLAELGFADWETWYEGAPGVPFIFSARTGTSRSTWVSPTRGTAKWGYESTGWPSR